MIRVVKSPPPRQALQASRRWQLQEAKAKFSQVFESALTSGPQVVTRRNRDSVVILSEAEYDKLSGNSGRPSLIEALLSCPKGPPLKVPARDPKDRVGAVPGRKPLFE